MNPQPNTPASLNEAVADPVLRDVCSRFLACIGPGGYYPQAGKPLTDELRAALAAPRAAIDAREQEIVAPGWNEAVEAAAKVLDNGSFLHKDSPEKKWAVQAAEAVRKLVVPLNAVERDGVSADKPKSAAPYISPREKRLREAVAKMHQWRDEKSAAAAASGKPTLQMLHEMAYLLKLVPRGSSVPVQILDVLSKQFEAAMAALASREQEAIYLTSGAITSDPAGTWRESSKEVFDRHPPEKRRIVYAHASRQEAPVASGEVPKWIDDPHDIEQGQMLNPAWLQLHNLTPSEALSPATVAQPVGWQGRASPKQLWQDVPFDMLMFRRDIQKWEVRPVFIQPCASQGCGGAVGLEDHVEAELKIPPEVVWPKGRDVGRIGDMAPGDMLRVGFDGDNDVSVGVYDEHGGAVVEFCTPGPGGGKSSRTRRALIALMVAMEDDNAEDPGRDWWARRAQKDAALSTDKSGGA